MRAFITSMSQEGYDLYGKQFLERAVECLPGNVVVYTESLALLNSRDIDEAVHWRDLNEVEGYHWFLDGIERFPVVNGMISGTFNYRFNLAKFCRKSFAQIHAASVHQDEMWWIDADVEFKSAIPEEFFKRALDGVFMAYLGRPQWHSCLSLAGFNNRHEDAARFWANYAMMYMTGQVLLLPEWHDSYIVDVVRQTLDIESRNMAGGLSLPDGPCNVFDSVMAPYAVHHKGNLKKRASGPARYNQLLDIVRERQPKRVLEVGTWNGQRAIEMNHVVEGGIDYHGFDLFEYADDETDEEEKNVKRHYSVEEVVDTLSKAGVRATLHVGNTRTSLQEFAEKHPEKFDLIFIDGGHSVETVRSDLQRCLKLVKSDGIIVMDDWYEGEEIDTDLWGCNKPVIESGYQYEVLPSTDPVQGGGIVHMVCLDPQGEQSRADHE